MNITVVGTGYVGLVSGACLAEKGNNVMCLDLDASKIAMLQRNEMPIFEPGLEDIVKRNVAAKRLHFTTDIKKAVAHGTIQFIAVGTPSDKDGSADLHYVLAAASNIGKFMNHYTIIVDKSTVPVGTADKVNKVIKEELNKRELNIPYSVVSNPEFLKEGAAIEDFMKPDRIIVGSNDERATEVMRSIYSSFQQKDIPLLVMDIRSAELTKYAANAMLATRISFMNELANLAELLGADIELVRQGIGSDPRIGNSFLNPGCGYGGSCFPKDIKALINTGAEHGRTLTILNAVEKVNELQKHVLTRKVKTIFGEDLQGLHFALWGLAFKPNTDDMREAASRVLINDLLEAGASVSAYDPVAMQEAKHIYGDHPDVKFEDSADLILQNADALLIVTEWQEFREKDLRKIKDKLKNPIIIDGRNLYDPKKMKAAGFIYHCIGRARTIPHTVDTSLTV